MTDRVHMPLNQAFLCLDDHCQSVGNDERTCVACGSKYPMPLANCLNRPETPVSTALRLSVSEVEAAMDHQQAIHLLGALMYHVPAYVPSIDPNSPELEGRN